MSFDETLTRIGSRLTLLHYLGAVALLVAVVLATLVANRPPSGDTPTPHAITPVAKSSGPSGAVVQAGPQWLELTTAQKKILQPLAGTWNSLGHSHKNKWIALTNNYPNRTPEDQAKLQSRMAEWAALTPSDRERARLNFAETKKLSPSTRATEWAAYQELSAEEKQSLAQKGKAKPTGAAVAVTPVSNDKLIAVPVTRRTAQLSDSSSVAKSQIDPNTLLPKPIAPAVGAQGATTTDSQVAPAPDRSSPVISSDTLSPN